MKPEDWNTIEREFPDLKTPTPPVCTANWDLSSWRRWYLSHAWRSEGGEFVHYKTGERRIWHPLAVIAGELAYNAGRRLNGGKRLR